MISRETSSYTKLKDKLIHKAERAGFDDDLDYLMIKINEFIDNDDQMDIF